MNRFIGGLLRALFDLRVIIGVCGVILSIVMHELFHIIMHCSEITDINLFPNSHAIVEILFASTSEYDLAIEEALAYVITAVTMVLTVMLIHDVNDLRDNRSVEQIIMARSYTGRNTDADKIRAQHQLSVVLGVKAASSR